MKLFVGNLSYDTTEPELRELFAPFEPIIEIRRPNDRETGKPRGFAFVTLADEATGNRAIEELDDSELGGRRLRVNEAEDRRGPRPPMRAMAPEDDPTSGLKKPVDDRPTGKDGKKVRYKSI